MMTTLRSNRRTRRNVLFNLECLDDRIVLSAGSAGVALEAHVAAAHVRSAEKAAVVHERHEARLAKLEMKEAAKVADFERFQPPPRTPVSPSPTPVKIGPGTATPYSSSSVNAAMVASPLTATSVNPISSTTAPVVTTSTPAPTSNLAVASPTPAATTSTGSNSGSSSTLPANLSAQLQSLYTQYEAYESSGGSGTFSPTGLLNRLVISGTNVGINFQSSDSADFNTFLSDLQSDGLQVSSDSATYGIVDGMLPIAQLVAVAQISSTASVTPMLQPMLS